MTASPSRIARRYLARETSEVLGPLFEQAIPTVTAAYEQVTGRPLSHLPPYVSVLSGERVPEGSVGLHEPPTDGRPYSILSVDSDALQRPEPGFLEQVVLHEAIHYVLSACGLDNPHDEVFQEIAAAVGLRPGYRD